MKRQFSYFLLSPIFVILLSIFTGLFILNHFFLVNFRTLANLEGGCSEDCLDNPVLLDRIRNAMIQPSGTNPVLHNPDAVNYKGQSGQVDTILEHFKNKVRK